MHAQLGIRCIRHEVLQHGHPASAGGKIHEKTVEAGRQLDRPICAMRGELDAIASPGRCPRPCPPASLVETLEQVLVIFLGMPGPSSRTRGRRPLPRARRGRSRSSRRSVANRVLHERPYDLKDAQLVAERPHGRPPETSSCSADSRPRETPRRPTSRSAEVDGRLDLELAGIEAREVEEVRREPRQAVDQVAHLARNSLRLAGVKIVVQSSRKPPRENSGVLSSWDAFAMNSSPRAVERRQAPRMLSNASASCPSRRGRRRRPRRSRRRRGDPPRLRAGSGRRERSRPAGKADEPGDDERDDPAASRLRRTSRTFARASSSGAARTTLSAPAERTTTAHLRARLARQLRRLSASQGERIRRASPSDTAQSRHCGTVTRRSPSKRRSSSVSSLRSSTTCWRRTPGSSGRVADVGAVPSPARRSSSTSRSRAGARPRCDDRQRPRRPRRGRGRP